MTRRSALAGLAPWAVCAQSGGNGGAWIPMFDGRSLKGWRETPFAKRGTVSVRDGMIVLGKGRLTGITWAGEFPRAGYEIRFEGARLEGNDYLALTFPVNDSHCEWVNGGWGGQVVGLSSLDGEDASENVAATFREFERGRWYDFRLAFDGKRIRCWIGGAIVIDVETENRNVGLRFGDSELSAPLGFSAYATEAGIRKIAYRRIAQAR